MAVGLLLLIMRVMFKKISGSEKNTTNNRMELMAPINALKEINPNERN